VAHNQRLTRKFWPVALFDGGIKRIAVDVGNAECFDFRVSQEPRPTAAYAGGIDHAADFAAAPAQGALMTFWYGLEHNTTLPRAVDRSQQPPASFPDCRGRQFAPILIAALACDPAPSFRALAGSESPACGSEKSVAAHYRLRATSSFMISVVPA
jgi:hypothetical protein